jgi:cell wall-associated NlpC family hydrolase
MAGWACPTQPTEPTARALPLRYSLALISTFQMTLLPSYSYGVPSATAEAGDLVFYDEHGYAISHVGIATGCGTVLHASTYNGAVVETPMYDIPGYVGARDVL